ncbi:hypothetical protein E1176_19910 [Fulvivirga sp. RKSG066]|uniref:hypothetical protein n=1 Tax=Fulvivirga aurantia TaxID=2529383 RepID=UPI0012BBF434|nr:hypothetical protein [Fulvivirga aurantia]MTI23305.1 hypothetical protein [Fulvivirga aurantia]
MLRNKKLLEQIIVSSLVSALILTSLVSWGRLLSQTNEKVNENIVVAEAKQATTKIKRGVMVFAGMVIVVAEYFDINDDE